MTKKKTDPRRDPRQPQIGNGDIHTGLSQADLLEIIHRSLHDSGKVTSPLWRQPYINLAVAASHLELLMGQHECDFDELAEANRAMRRGDMAKVVRRKRT